MTVQDALALHRAGRFAEAEAAYRQVLAAQPNHYHALHFLGVLRAQTGAMTESADLIRRALALKPGDALAHFHLGETLRKLGQFGQAGDHYGKAVTHDPAFAPAYVGLAGCLLKAGRVEEALACCAEGQKRDNANPDLQAVYGDALLASARPNEAFAAYAKALVLAPGHLAALIGQGRVLAERGETDAALAAFAAAASAHPGEAEPLLAKASLSNRQQALAAFQEALAINPADPDVYYALGCHLLDGACEEAAIAAFDSALTLRPDFAEAHYNRSYALRKLGRDDEALAGCERTLALDPGSGFAATLSLLIRSLRCDWTGREAALRTTARLVAAGKAADPFALLGAFDDPAMHLRAARSMAGTAAPAILRNLSGKRLRLGYISPNFHPHPVAYQAVSVFEAHDADRFETFGICTAPGPETPIRQRLRGAFTHFVEAPSDRALANRLRQHQIDIAIDLAGHTSGGRLPALRAHPAPITAAWLGYPGTTGTSSVDYIIADSVLIPPEDEPFYTEKVVRLPFGYMPRDTSEVLRPCPPRASLGLPQQGVVFCGFNNSFKLTPEVFGCWLRLLSAVPGSVLWLNIQNAMARENLQRAAGGLAECLIFAERAEDRTDHLARLAAADIFLDTLPYGAHSTASDMLWAGVPVVTCRGSSFASRVSASLLTALALEALIATELRAYEEIALALARDPSRRASVRTTLCDARNSAALYDARRFCDSLETAYEEMAERYRRGQNLRSFSVNMGLQDTSL